MSTPQTFLVGVTQPDNEGIRAYLEATGQEEFYSQFLEAQEKVGPLCLVSFYAKLCYKSLVLGRNKNVSKIRDIEENLMGCVASGHGSVFEHVCLNFITTNCSRVFTHELVRHRIGTAYSQTSGRYVTVEDAELVLPPAMDLVELEPGDPDVGVGPTSLADAYVQTLESIKKLVAHAREKLDLDNRPMSIKKWWTSQLRRIMPNGQTNEIGWSVNVRSLRHIIQMRTSRHAEWEIRKVFHDVAQIVEERWPLMLHGGTSEIVDGFVEWSNLRV